MDALKSRISESNIREAEADSQYNMGGIIPLNKKCWKVLKVTFLEAKVYKNEEIQPEHLMLSILKHKDNTASILWTNSVLTTKHSSLELEFVRQEWMYYSDFNQAPSDSDTLHGRWFGKWRRQHQGSWDSWASLVHRYSIILQRCDPDWSRKASLRPHWQRNWNERVSQILSRERIPILQWARCW